MTPNPSNIIPARIGPGGVLMFPRRGKPPGPVDGYEDDKGDPFVKKPILKPCNYRNLNYQRVCGGVRPCILCSYYSIKVSIADCLQCKVN